MSFAGNQELFIDEAKELLGSLERSLMELELQPEQANIVDDVFRCLHTIKGSGAMFGFTEVSEFTHLVENLFDDIRNDQIAINPDIINIGLRACDCINNLLEGKEPGDEQAKLVQQLAVLAKKTAHIVPSADQKDLFVGSNDQVDELEHTVDLPHVWNIKLKPEPSILHRGIKLEALFTELAALGTYHCTADVHAIPDLESLSPSDVAIAWNITLSTSLTLQAIRAVFLFVEEYAEIGIEQIDQEVFEFGVPKLGEVLVRRGLINEAEVQNILQVQRPFGEVAIESGKITHSELEAALAEQQIIKSTTVEREVRQDSGTIRVRKEKLDFLVDAVGELVILQAHLNQEANRSADPIFESIAENLGRLTTVLRDASMSIRMVPLAESFLSYQRLVHDLSLQLKKDLRLVIQGASTELDKNIIESLKDPLVHIIRNSADHGIESSEARTKAGKPETGTITIAASQVGSTVEITIKDDGRGLDLEKIKAEGLRKNLISATENDRGKIMALIFNPGFSTAQTTTKLSGRGVGMDIVKTNIEKLRGTISVSSESGQGTSIVLSIPLTLVIIDGLLVKIGTVDYVIALSSVQECVDYDHAILQNTHTGTMIGLRGKSIPVIDLYRLLMGSSNANELDKRLVVISLDGAEVALKVDAVVGKQQVVIKPFSMALKKMPLVSGATILGDGSVALILNTNELAKTFQNHRGT